MHIRSNDIAHNYIVTIIAYGGFNNASRKTLTEIEWGTSIALLSILQAAYVSILPLMLYVSTSGVWVSISDDKSYTSNFLRFSPD